jgi:predicted aspartyl protease
MPAFFHRICAGAALAAGLGILLPAQGVTHSVPIDVIHGKPFVKVTINGKGPFRFVIDTGTGGEAFVSAELAEQLGLPATGQARLSDPSRQGGQRVPMVAIQSLNVAGVEFTGVKAAVHSLSDDEGDCQGLLGFVLFRNYLLTLDFPNRRMMLATGSLAPDGERSVLPFRMPDGVPIVPMRIGGMKVDAQIDSGGSGLSLPEQISSHLKFSAGPVAFSNGQSLSTRFQIKAAMLATDVHLGGYTFSRPFVEINPAFPLANFGSCPMQSFAMTFDQKNGLVRLVARQKQLRLAATPAPMRLQSTPPPRPPDQALVPVG